MTTPSQARVSAPIADLETDSLLADFAEGPRLVGTQCAACGQRMIGSRVVCSSCVSTDVTRVALANTGVLYSFTRLHPSAEIVRPLGYVDLEDGVRTLADIREGDVPLEPGIRVELGVDGNEWFFTRIHA